MLRWLSLLLFCPALLNAEVVSLTSQNFEQTIRELSSTIYGKYANYHVSEANELVFVNFYADWCRFSQMLKPIFLEASEKFKDAAPGKIMWASVDADKNSE